MSLDKSDLHQSLFINTKGGIRLLLLPVLHGGSGMTTGGAHKFIKVNYLWARGMSDIKEQGNLFKTLPHLAAQSDTLTRFFLICCSQIVCSWWQSAATDGECEQNTLTRHIFSCFKALVSMSHVTFAQGVLRARHPCIIRMLLLSWYSSTLHSALFTVSLIFLFILLIFIFIFHVGWFDEKSHVLFREWGVRHVGREQSSHSFRKLKRRVVNPTRFQRRLMVSTTTRSKRPLKSSSKSPPATAGPQTCMTRRLVTTLQSALFFTVHSGARRSSEP